MTRPDDVPSWGESTRRCWRWSKWLLTTIPVALLFAWWIQGIAYKAPRTPFEALEISLQTTLMYQMMLVLSGGMWLLIFLNGILNERWAKTPKELEIRERKLLAELQNKYPDA